MQKYFGNVIIGLSYILSGGSMFAFVVFLYAGHLNLVNLGLDEPQALLLNAGLSLAFFILPVAGFFWAVKALGLFDPFGIKGILDYQRNKKSRPVAFTVRGPYQWVRHPLYLFMLVMIWSCPNLTADRLLFNILWSVWIFIGTILEDRDLTAQFGDAYRKYQKKVPMLLPFNFIGKESPSLN